MYFKICFLPASIITSTFPSASKERKKRIPTTQPFTAGLVSMGPDILSPIQPYCLLPTSDFCSLYDAFIRDL